MVVAEGTIHENFVKFIPSLRPLHMERGRGHHEILFALTRERLVLHIGANRTLPARFISQQKIPKTWSFVRFRRKFSKKVQVQKKRPQKIFLSENRGQVCRRKSRELRQIFFPSFRPLHMEKRRGHEKIFSRVDARTICSTNRCNKNVASTFHFPARITQKGSWLEAKFTKTS